MKQEGKEWLDWRGEALGSSDAPIVLGSSPYKTPYELWMEKTGRMEPEQDKFAFALGHAAEPYIRRLAESRLGEIFEPYCTRSKLYPFMQASLDGITLRGDIFLEIKVNTKDVHNMLKSKFEAIPGHHYSQIQHQYLCVPNAACVYVSAPFKDDFADLKEEDLVIWEVPRNDATGRHLIEVEAGFIESLANDTPPALIARDGVQISSERWKRNAAAYKQLAAKMSALKKEQALIKDHLVEMSGQHPIAKGEGVCVKNTLIAGNVQYKKIPELKDVDLDAYRSQSYVKTTLSVAS